MTSRPRVIPVLLLRNRALVKTVRFEQSRYVGDPVNAVRIFNDLQADEIVLVDIDATREKRTIPVDIVRDAGAESMMPLAVGGGIRTMQQIHDLLTAGAEKVVVCSKALSDPSFVREASKTFGASTVVVCIDVRASSHAWGASGTIESRFAPTDFAKRMEEEGAGEIIIQSIDRDGTMQGYDLELITRVSDAVTIPVIALGGAGELEHLRNAYEGGHASAAAAGSLFVHYGRHRAVLISYPTRVELPF